jgi:Crp-like helix-turn-helix domain
VLIENPMHVTVRSSMLPAAAAAGHRNAALAGLAPADFALIRSGLRSQLFQKGRILWDAGAPVGRVYFPLSGTISLMLPMPGCFDAIEVGSIGREAAAGGFAASDEPTCGVVGLSGEFLFMAADTFAAATQRSPDFARIATRAGGWLFTQARQLAACNAAHRAPARVSRWLCQAADQAEGSAINATQETIADSIGIRRTTMTLIAQALRKEGLIGYRRGRIWINDHRRLQAAACSCYATLMRRNSPFWGENQK